MTTKPSEPLVCPSCASTHVLTERFCPSCGMPLVYAGAGVVAEGPITTAHERARRIKPQLTEGRLVTVAGARHQAEAEMIQNMLLEEGVPSILRRTRGFDVPDMLAAGPRDVLVPESGAQIAHEVLLSADMAPSESEVTLDPPWKVLVGLLIALAIVALIALVAF